MTNNVVGISVAIGVGGVVVSGVVIAGGSTSATAVDISTGTAVAADDNNAVGAVVTPSSTKD